MNKQLIALSLVALMVSGTVVMAEDAASPSAESLEAAGGNTGISSQDGAGDDGGNPFSDDRLVIVDRAAGHESRDEELAVENSGAQPAAGEGEPGIDAPLPTGPSESTAVVEDLSGDEEAAIENGALLDENGYPIEGTGRSPTVIH
ncbi:MAG: hypothetical protein GX442_10710 [Candidatus Riflebacteria bacterium]|nr:hypothetical protein [Candidatus Riflebacteria bacterium]